MVFIICAQLDVKPIDYKIQKTIYVGSSICINNPHVESWRDIIFVLVSV